MGRVSVFTLIDRSTKNMGAVDPKVKALAIELIKRAYHEGINVQITSGLRTYTEQDRLYAQGRTRPGNIVTNAKAGQSIHNFGLAIDYVLVNEDGSKAIWSVTSEWRRVAAIGKQLGFQWGGDWSSFRDYPHLDMQRGLSLAQLRAGKRPSIPSVPERTWIGPGDTGKRVEDMQRYLNEVGIKTDVDGFYGPGTEKAVRTFQSRRGLSVDGLYGPGSLAEMNVALKEGSKPQVETAAPKKEEPKMADYKKDAQPPKSLEREWTIAKDLGITDGTYPDRPMTRAEGVAIIVRALELDK